MNRTGEAGLPALLRLAKAVAEEAAQLVVERRAPGASGAASAAGAAGATGATGATGAAGATSGGADPAGRADGERGLGIETKSSATDLVTEVDRAAEALILGRLLDARPDDGIVGEEGANVAGTSGVVWLVDPIDGTTNYVYDHPGFAVSVAASIDGTPAVGVVVDPRHGELFEATAGGGARRNGTTVRARGGADLATALVATGFSYDPAQRRRQAELLVQLLPAVRDIRRMGAASVDLCSLACGRVDAYFETGLNPWDYAAGALIAEEGGARVTDLYGGRPSASFCLGSSPQLYTEFAALLRSWAAPQG